MNDGTFSFWPQACSRGSVAEPRALHILDAWTAEGEGRKPAAKDCRPVAVNGFAIRFAAVARRGEGMCARCWGGQCVKLSTCTSYKSTDAGTVLPFNSSTSSDDLNSSRRRRIINVSQLACTIAEWCAELLTRQQRAGIPVPDEHVREAQRATDPIGAAACADQEKPPLRAVARWSTPARTTPSTSAKTNRNRDRGCASHVWSGRSVVHPMAREEGFHQITVFTRYLGKLETPTKILISINLAISAKTHKCIH
jgi:hypothetical protein